MGTYLAKPVLEKSVMNGCDLDCDHTPLSWACVDMQGWRKSMEDAHVARTDVPYDSVPRPSLPAPDGHGGVNIQQANGNAHFARIAKRAKVFAVFDGHGGSEVSRFCERHLVDVIVSQEKWKRGDVKGALVDVFHALDRMIDDPSRRKELADLRSLSQWHITRPFGPKADAEKAAQKGENPLSSPSRAHDAKFYLETCLGAAGLRVGHSKVEEHGAIAQSDCKQNDNKEEDDVDAFTAVEVSEDGIEPNSNLSTIQSNSPKEGGLAGAEAEAEGEGDCEGVNLTTGEEESNSSNSSLESVMGSEPSDASLESFEVDDLDGENVELEIDDEGAGGGDTEVVDNSAIQSVSSTDAMTIFQKVLSMKGARVRDEDGNVAVLSSVTSSGDDSITLSLSSVSADKPSITSSSPEPAPDDVQVIADSTISTVNSGPTDACGVRTALPSASNTFCASRNVNGRLTCTLPDHPVQAGCTAIVAIMVGRTLIVANAGDSRAVLGRAGGRTHPLSFDHKPLHDREMERIRKAGGFVNQFGRVNGNLNLSRSIGDLKYKQTPGLTPSEQMITAEPDVTQVTLQPDDEFVIIGCDGIWDCVTNEQAVEYVRYRIDDSSPTDIIAEMLDDIVSKDPRATQGLGGDNMTCIIIDLLPHTRKYSSRPGVKGGHVTC